MAREEHDRDDLFAEAAALVPRVELALEGWATPLVAGLHREGGLSIYFDADTVWHFNAEGEIRRAYLDGKLYKAEQRRLVALTRERTADAVHLVRDELDDTATGRLLADLTQRLNHVASALAASSFRILRQVPAEEPVLATLQSALCLTLPLRIALRPNVG